MEFIVRNENNIKNHSSFEYYKEKFKSYGCNQKTEDGNCEHFLSRMVELCNKNDLSEDCLLYVYNKVNIC